MGMLQLNTRCSAACSHCPYKRGGRDFSLAEVAEQLDLDEESYVTLSGGEPLEHGALDRVLTLLRKRDVPFRIATGGHLPLESILTRVKSWPVFLGISLGTDVISGRNGSASAVGVWFRNLDLLRSESIRFSITVTLGHDYCFDAVLSSVINTGHVPQFIMINRADGFSEREFLAERSRLTEFIADSIWSDVRLI